MEEEQKTKEPMTLWEKFLWYSSWVLIAGAMPAFLGWITYEDSPERPFYAVFVFLAASAICSIIYLGFLWIGVKLQERSEREIDRQLEKQRAYEALPKEVRQKKERRGNIISLILLSAFYIIFSYSYFSGRLDIKDGWFEDYGIPIAIVFFSVMLIVFWIGVLRGWSNQRTEDAVVKSMAWLLASPVLAVAFGVPLYFAFSYLTTITSWAAIIIILLVFLVLKKQP